jgi:phenylalanyl-tRNA synthetase beta chain
VHRKASSLRFFEIGNRYRRGQEETVLALTLYGSMEENWTKKHPSTFYDLKGIVENVMDFLGAKGAEWAQEVSDPALTGGCDLVEAGKILGSAGEVTTPILAHWDIPHEVFYAEIVLDDLFDRPRQRLGLRPVSRFPVVRRDIAFIIDNRVSVKDLQTAMRNAASPYLHSVTLFDQFTGKNVPEGKRSLAFSLSYQKEDGTFTDEEIQNLQKRLGESLKKLYQVEFR